MWKRLMDGWAYSPTMVQERIKHVNPTHLEAHPVHDGLFLADNKRGRIITQNGTFRHRPLVTDESHFTDAEWTIIAGHRRVETAKAKGVESIEVEIVGPFDSETAEHRAVLESNDYRQTTAAEEIRYAREWEAVYEAKGRTETALEHAVDHIDLPREAYRRGTVVADRVSATDERVRTVATEAWEGLIHDEMTIDEAYLAVRNAEEVLVTRRGRAPDGDDPAPTVDADDVASWGVDASRLVAIYTSPVAIESLLQWAAVDTTVDPLAAEQFIEFRFTSDQTAIETHSTGFDLRNTIVVGNDVLGDVHLHNTELIRIAVRLRDLRIFTSNLESTATIELWGDETAGHAHLLTLTDGRHQFRLSDLRETEQSRELPPWLTAETESWLPDE